MIVDCHTHIPVSPNSLGEEAVAFIRRQGTREMSADPATPSRTVDMSCVDRTLVLAYCSTALGEATGNDALAEYVRSHSGTIGIAGVNPTEDGAIEEAACLLDREEFRGLTLSPAMQNFHPADTRAMMLYELANNRGVPVFFQNGTPLPPCGRMEYARPLLLDEIAREFPNLTFIISSLGHPWTGECIAMLGKNTRVFADIAGLVRRPWQAYNSLVLAHQFNVMDKVLFGSDFPYLTPAEAMESVYRLHEVTQGTNLPSVPREVLRTMVERDSLTTLGLPGGEETAPVGGEKESHSTHPT